MEKFKNIRGIAAPFNFINVDTDKIIPKQFLKTIKRTGLGKHLFDEMRFNDDGSEKEEFVLNKNHIERVIYLLQVITLDVVQVENMHPGLCLILE